MTKTSRSTAVAIELALCLVLTSYNMALVRGAAAATGQASLCIGDNVEIVYVDANGAPTVAPHVCPECIVTFAIGQRGVDTVLRTATASPEHTRIVTAKVRMRAVLTGFQGRAPPADLA